MNQSLLKGLWKYTIPIPSFVWERKIIRKAGQARKSIQFMTPDHHRVRNFVVKELPTVCQPLTPDAISEALNLRQDRVLDLLDDLEKHKLFLYRNPCGAVHWAYPVTVEKTPHLASFPAGEKIYAA